MSSAKFEGWNERDLLRQILITLEKIEKEIRRYEENVLQPREEESGLQPKEEDSDVYIIDLKEMRVKKINEKNNTNI